MLWANIDEFLVRNLNESIEELIRYCTQPSISAQGIGLQETAEMTANMLIKRGFQVQIFATGGAPIVVANRQGRNTKTLLFYNHYDVQPPEPLELWVTPPFQPDIREGRIFARGVNDNKGSLMSRLFAIDAILSVLGEIPCSVKFIVEGEEEVSSLHLRDFVCAHKMELAADGCVWEFGGVDHRDHPMQYLGLRGICYVELSIETAAHDIHSGLGGSILPNAAWRLVWALSTLKDAEENILIPGFYDSIIPPSQRDLELMEALPDASADYLKRYGVSQFLHGLRGGVELMLAEYFKPTCTICGLTSGYQGSGSKTIIPKRASAKVDFRLVPNQKPDEILRLLRTHLDSQGFSDIQVDYLGGDAPGRTDPDDPFVKMVLDASKGAYGMRMQIVPMVGGSGPNHVFIENLKIPIVSAGPGDPGGNVHAPNENIRIDQYLNAAKHAARIMGAMGGETLD